MDRLEGLNITADELQAYMQEHAAYITGLAPELDTLRPTLLVLARAAPGEQVQRHLMILAVPFTEPSEKRAALMRCGQSFYEQELFPVAVVMATEAWMAPKPKEGRNRGWTPADSPDREEVVVVFGCNMDRSVQGMMRASLSREHGKLAVGTFSDPSMDGADCRILSAFYMGFCDPVASKAEMN